MPSCRQLEELVDPRGSRPAAFDLPPADGVGSHHVKGPQGVVLIEIDALVGFAEEESGLPIEAWDLALALALSTNWSCEA